MDKSVAEVMQEQNALYCDQVRYISSHACFGHFLSPMHAPHRVRNDHIDDSFGLLYAHRSMHESVRFLSTISAIVGDAADKAERAALEAKRIGLDGTLPHACHLVDVWYDFDTYLQKRSTHTWMHAHNLIQHRLRKPYHSPGMQAS